MNLAKIYDDTAEKMAKGLNAAADDYTGPDGLLYCGKCHTAKQCRVKHPFKDQIDTQAQLCKCEIEARRKVYYAHENEAKRRECFEDQKMMQYTFAADDGSNDKVLQALKSYVDNFDTFRQKEKGLLLYGPVGTGKTFAAACVANALIDNGVAARMTDFRWLENTLWGMSGGRQDFIDSFNRYPLLIFDDLATERKTEYMKQIVFDFIDNRYKSGLPMIITTNLSLEELKNPEGVAEARCYDRILERCFPLEVAGASRRRKKIIADYNETKELLGL